jgi:RNA polymerase sigma factor (TIGR02999 family)
MCATDDTSEEPCASAVTRLLNEAAGGKSAAAAALLPLVYDQLRRLAANKMRQQPADHTLQPTALVHEAYVRLVHDTGVGQWDGRRHFFAVAAEAMRCILVDHARRRNRLKRGGGIGGADGERHRISLDALEATIGEPSEDVLALDEALTALAREHPDKAQLVKLRYFAGLTIDEAAGTLGISTATAQRRWAFSRAWLYKRISDGRTS